MRFCGVYQTTWHACRCLYDSGKICVGSWEGDLRRKTTIQLMEFLDSYKVKQPYRWL